MSDAIEVTLSWNPNIAAIVDGAIASGLNKAGAHLQGKMRTNFATVGGIAQNYVSRIQRWKYKRATAQSGHGHYSAREGGQRIWVGHYLKGSRTGKRLRSSTERNVYAAAAPGEFPGVRSGELRQSIGIINATKSNLVVTVGTNVKHGRHLEYGTRKMPARPWCRRTFNEERKAMTEILRVETQKIITAKLGGK